MNKIGQRFGRLLVIGESPRSQEIVGGGRRRSYWDAKCDCGGTITTRWDALSSGRARSCGCLNTETRANQCRARATHGKSRSRVYRSWLHMRERCTDPNDKRWAHYGGRGITYCDRWESFDNFLADMGEPPEGKTLERKNNNLGYSPENCIWATHLEQSRNRSNSVRVITSDGLVPLQEYADSKGLTYGGALSRVRLYGLPAVRMRELA